MSYEEFIPDNIYKGVIFRNELKSHFGKPNIFYFDINISVEEMWERISNESETALRLKIIMHILFGINRKTFILKSHEAALFTGYNEEKLKFNI